MDESATPETSTLMRLEGLLLGGRRTLNLEQLAERIGMDREKVRLFWHALGLGTTDPSTPVFTEDDARVLTALLTVADDREIGTSTMVSLVRAVGHSTERLVTWQSEVLVDHLAHRHDLDDATARLLLLDRLTEISRLLELQLVHGWRRHMAAFAERVVAEHSFASATGAPGDLPLPRAVGFADMVGFTTRVSAMTAGELASFVEEFEAGLRDVIGDAGGRVVKTIGDAVLFVADDMVTGARVALGLAEQFGAGSSTPVRVGAVWGRVLSRFGDVFGPPVNLAARLTDEADPGTVLLDAPTATLIADDDGFRFTPLPEREVPGLGVLRPVRLDRG